jgi:RNA polymerase sigma-70 factor (ECF subfamily)
MAKAGDRVALQQLLVQFASRLSAHIAPHVPPSLQSVLSTDDILQQTYMSAFRDIGRFEPQSDGSFFAWLRAIADHRTQDAIRTLKRVKRGGDRLQVRGVSDGQSRSVSDLVELLSAGSHTPSRSVAGHEAVQAVQNAIRDLPADYRQAVQLRLLDGMSLEDVATAMNRSPRSVQGLVDRAKKKMREALGRLSLYQ